jgi:hypothetical protein
MSDSVAKRTPVATAMVEATRKGRDLMGGTAAMRAAGTRYLPKFKAELKEDYDARLGLSWLFNGYKKTVRDMSGRVFDRPVEVAEAPSQIIDWSENIDMQGRDLSTFAAEVFKDGFASGVSYIMVDAPRREGQTTRAQAASEGLRPYLVHIKAEDILGWKTATYGNALALSQLRIMETLTEDDPKDEFASVLIEQVRVLDRLDNGVRVRLFHRGTVANKETWILHDEYETEASEITVAPYYAARTGFFTGEPVLEDLADVNIAHWQSQSDQRHILQKARVPILFGRGIDEDTEIVIGASTAITSRDPQAELKWVEHTGAAIASGRQDLKDLEFQMETMGLQLLVARTQTATGAALDAAKETTQLASMADSLKDALEQALEWMAEYGGLGEQSITVTINTDFGVSMMTPQEMQGLLMAVNTGKLSRETFLEEMKRRGMLREDLDTEEEMDRIDADGPDLEGSEEI